MPNSTILSPNLGKYGIIVVNDTLANLEVIIETLRYANIKALRAQLEQLVSSDQLSLPFVALLTELRKQFQSDEI